MDTPNRFYFDEKCCFFVDLEKVETVQYTNTGFNSYNLFINNIKLYFDTFEEVREYYDYFCNDIYLTYVNSKTNQNKN